MALLDGGERAVARAVSGLVYGNPFLPERIAHEKTILGDEFVGRYPVWHTDNPNLLALHARVERLADDVRRRLTSSRAAAPPDSADLALYEDLVLYLLFYRYFDDLFTPIRDQSARMRRLEFFDRF